MNTRSTTNLRNIIARIESGELEHNQTSYFCDTACDIAGWDVVLNSAVQPENPRDRVDWHEYYETYPYGEPFRWSMEHNKLTNAEACLIFSATSTLEFMKAVLDQIDLGRFLSESDDSCKRATIWITPGNAIYLWHISPEEWKDFIHGNQYLQSLPAEFH